MSHQRVLNPRAYLNMIAPMLINGKMSLTSGSFSNSDISGSGLISSQSDVLQLFDNNPANVVNLGGKTASTTQYITIDTHFTNTGTLLGETMFVAILNHNLYTAGAGFRVQCDSASNFSTNVTTPAMTEVCNATDDTSTNFHEPGKDGWSLATYSQTTNNRYQRIVITPNATNYSVNVNIGCIIWGIVYDFPQSPDLKLTQTFVHNGVKKTESLGGQIYGHATYTGNPAWLDNSDPFANTTGTRETSFKSGKKQLDLSFTYMSDTNVFTEKLYEVDSSTDDDSLLSRIVWFTHNGMHPFLLQYDNSDVTDLEGDDEFLFCRLNNTPKFEQVAHRQYSTQLSFIEEF